MKKLEAYQSRLILLTLFAVFALCMGAVAAYEATKDITVIINPNTAGQSSEEIVLTDQKMNQTVEELLTNNNISTDNYSISVSKETSIRNLDEIELKKMVQGSIYADSATAYFDSNAETVGDLIEEYGISVGEDDYVSPSVDTPLTCDIQEVHIDRVEYRDEVREEEIPFDSQITEDRSLPASTVSVVSEGQTGLKRISERARYVNGVRIDAEVLSEEILKEPVTQVQTQNSIGIATSGHQAYSVSDSDFNIICAIVQHEGGSSYDSALAVMSTVLNRADAGNWGGGSDPLGILTASGQFESYFGGYYTQYLGNCADTVKQAVTDCLNGVRNHKFQSFRGYETTGSVQIGGGNYYFNEGA